VSRHSMPILLAVAVLGCVASGGMLARFKHSGCLFWLLVLLIMSRSRIGGRGLAGTSAPNWQIERLGWADRMELPANPTAPASSVPPLGLAWPKARHAAKAS
jgi:hypothetical protein